MQCLIGTEILSAVIFVGQIQVKYYDRAVTIIK
jgi:hypothetical protein